ncbi:YwbE family protein [Desulfovibrio aminophilus]|uniref:YwbE family protein n=1 Tax=Desulfovibrio aminophilus TaxID=81425 RepID=UPI00041E1457|nr:YwbE family protein [Desulfovibrio aminophilus]
MKQTASSSGTFRKNIVPGLRVLVVRKQDQRSGKTTEGVVRDILTSAAVHTRGIKVRLTSGEVGRVREILGGRE